MDGLLMGTRPGEIDPAAVLYLASRDPKGIEGVQEMLNHRAGLAGITGGTSDMRDIIKKRDAGDARAGDAVDVFCYRIVKDIGAYMTVLGGADAIVFTGGIGENASAIRQQVGDGLQSLGVAIDAERNQAVHGVEAAISAAGSRVPVWVVPTDEELWIARDAFRCSTCASI
jgi:acetate kinase